MAPRHIARYTPENVASAPGGRLFSPSFSRNFEPIRQALGRWLDGRTGTVLEVASGTGQHVAHLALAFPRLRWVPSDIYPEHHASISAWGRETGAANLAAPIFVDAAADWPADPAVAALGPLAAVFASNLLHIAPWPVAEGLVNGAAAALAPGGMLILYGPFRRGDAPLGPGNAEFDAGLRAENPDWGLRDIEVVSRLAGGAGLGPAELVEMPANNLVAGFVRLSSG